MNPILPCQHHVPDGEARVYNGRMYIYGSYDKAGCPDYCSNEYRVFSSDNLIDWTDHGVSFKIDGALLYAPDCIERDGKYYLYYCTSDNRECVAVSDKPEGPFEDLGEVIGASGDGIDPAIFIDDDGQAYYYWGQFKLRGGRLNEDMKTLDPDSINRCLLDEYEHGFHEGSSMRKRNGIYYLVYADISRGKATCLAYATSTSPLGPFKKQGVIIDNNGCDPETWNNHGSICEFNGQWYVIYHRSSRGSVVNRRACIEPIYFDENGLIKEVPMTTIGPGKPHPANETLGAWRACYLKGRGRIAPIDCDDANEAYVDAANKDWICFKTLNFTGEETIMEMELRSTGKVSLHVTVGSFVGQHHVCVATYEGGEGVLRCPINSVSGVQTLYISVINPDDEQMALKTIRFC